MAVFFVVENPKRWPLHVPGTDVVSARDYLTDRRFFDAKRARVFNLCRSYGYQTLGYYVSLLAAARGHRPVPSVTTIQDLRQSALVRVVGEDIEPELQRALHRLRTKRFDLSIYFGRNLAKRYDRLCQALHDYFPVPLLRAEFVRQDKWRLQNLRTIATSEIPATHREFVIEQAQRYLSRPRSSGRKHARFHLAILVNADEVDSPSDEKAIKRFIRAGRQFDIAVSLIGRQDYGRIAEFDALFLRETTQVNHRTYQFAARAQAEGLVVIDDPESIVRCTNKVYQAELFERNGIACPKTMVVHRANSARVAEVLGLPCVLKRPDSSFSAGVEKAESEEELQHCLEAFFEDSELVVAQEFVPSSYDWRVGVLDGKALFACKYHMARGHWQIQVAVGERGRRYGRVETLPVAEAPADAVGLAVRAAQLIGGGLYGVDIKQVDGRYLVMEVNDSPNIEAGCEDAVLKDELYTTIMAKFLERLEPRGRP